MKFYKCDLCGQVVAIVNDRDLPISCCGTEMKEIIPHVNEDQFKEKHIPTYEIKDNKVYVKVGEVPHPMDFKHYISWIFIHTDKGNQRKTLHPGDKPEATFCLDDDEELLEIYAYCNIHSLWVKCTKKGDKACKDRKVDK